MIREGAASTDQTGADSAPVDEAKVDAPIAFKRNFFLNLPDTTGAKPSVPESKKWLKRKEETPKVEVSEWVQFPDQTRQEMTTFLDNFVTNTHSLLNSPDGREILKSQPHAIEIMNVLGVTESTIDVTDLDSKIKVMLEKPQGWVLAKTLLDQQTAMQTFALGLMASAELNKKNINPELLFSAKPTSEGRFGKVGNMVGKYTRRNTAIAGGVIGGLAGYDMAKLAENVNLLDAVNFLATHFPTDKAAAFGLLTAAGGAVLGHEMGKDPDSTGKNTDTSEKTGFAVSKDVLQSIKDDPKYARYVKEVMGIDVSDFEIDEESKAIKLSDHPKSTNNLESILKGIKSNLKTRNHYYDALGVPPEDRDIMPEQFILKNEANSYERTGERVNAAILKRFHELGGGDAEQDLKLYRKARELVLADLTEDLVGKIGTESQRSITDIDTKITERTAEDGRIIKEKREKAAKDAPELREMLDGSIRPRLGHIEAYDQAQKSLSEAKKALPKFLSKTFGPEVETIDDAEKKLRDARRGTSYVEFNIDGRVVRIEGIEKRRREAREAFNDSAVELMRTHRKENDEPQDTYRDRIKTLGLSLKEEHDADLAEINRDAAVLDELESKIKSFKDAIKASEQALDPQGDLAVARHGALYHRTTDRDKAFQLTENTEVQKLLLTGTTSEILKKINELHKANPDFGWEEADNDDLVKDQLLAFAIVVARATKNDADSIRSFRNHPNLGKITQEGVTYEQLEFLSVPELKELISDPELDETKIGEAQITIKEYAKNLIKATREVGDELGIRIRRADRLAEKVDLSEEIDQLEVTKALMKRQGEIFGLTAEVISDVTNKFPVSEDKLKKISKVSSLEKSSYTSAEKALAGDQPVAYYEILNTLFDYQKKTDREEQFKKISKVLTPKRLYEIISEVSGEDIKGEDLGQILFSLQDNIRKGLVSRRALRGIFEGIIDATEAKALTLP